MSEISKLIAEIKSEGILRAGNKLEQLYSMAEQMETNYAELQQKLDALAADIALNDWVACSPEWIDKNGPCSCEAAPRIAFGNIGPHYHPKSFTTATDAYLNSVRAEGVEMFNKHFNCADISDDITHFAAQLRSGTHDTADKAG